MKTAYLAIDIGASSGRHIVGWSEGGEMRTEEVYRFPNGVTEQDGHLTWDIDALLGHVKQGITIAKEKYPQIKSLSTDISRLYRFTVLSILARWGIIKQ